MGRLLLHAVTRDDLLPADGWTGLRGRPLRRVGAGPLVAWATEWTPAEPPGRADLVQSHALVQAIWESAVSCLPVRFPSWAEDEADLASRVRARSEELERALTRLAGTAELAVTVAWAATAPGPATGVAEGRVAPPDLPSRPGGDALDGTRVRTGRAYMEALQSRQAGAAERELRAQEIVRAFDGELAGDVLEARHSLTPGDSVAVSSALLVRRPRAAAVRATITRTSSAWNDVRTLVNGPWPPYSFAAPARPTPPASWSDGTRLPPAR